MPTFSDAPGLQSIEEIETVCRAVSKPVNVLARPSLTVDEIVAAGGQRISVGGSFARVAMNALVEAATEVRDTGDLSSLATRHALSDWLSSTDPDKR